MVYKGFHLNYDTSQELGSIKAQAHREAARRRRKAPTTWRKLSLLFNGLRLGEDDLHVRALGLESLADALESAARSVAGDLRHTQRIPRIPLEGAVRGFEESLNN